MTSPGGRTQRQEHDPVDQHGRRRLRAVGADAAESGPGEPARSSPGAPLGSASPGPAPRDVLQQALRRAHHLGLFTGPSWTVLLAQGPAAGSVVFPFVVRARDSERAQVAAAAVLQRPGLVVVAVIPGAHPPVDALTPKLAAEHARAKPTEHAAARAVFDAHLLEYSAARGDQVRTPQPRRPAPAGRTGAAPPALAAGARSVPQRQAR